MLSCILKLINCKGSAKRKKNRERKGKTTITSAGNLSAIPLYEGILFPGTDSVSQPLLQCEANV